MLRSLRSRFIIGTVLWTSGLLAIAHLLSIVLLHHFPRLMRTPHTRMVFIAVVLMIIGLAIVRSGLSLLKELRARLADVREGRAQRVEGTYPSEVEPLVEDLNAFLDHREEIVRRALAKAGDLAHGLKTPLAVLAQDDDPLVREQVERMRRQIEYHLAHARAAASGATPGTRCSVLASAEALARTLLRLHADRGLTIDVNVAPEHTVRVEREDLDEMLGNLLDNACKWAKSRVVITSSIEEASVIITVDDDGAGLNPSMRERVLQRGVRADEAAAGSGFGLAIVRDIADLYRGTLSLEASPANGVRARLALPRF